MNRQRLPRPLSAHVLRRLARAVMALPGLVIMAAAHADLTVVGTRHIYPGGEKSLTIQTGNAGDRPILVQVWLDEGATDADPSLLSVPFVLTPPVFRIEPRERMAVTLRHTGEAMPTDRESLFWINFLNIPSRDAMGPNVLKLSHRFRMKVLYRPPGLPGSAREAIAQLRWTYRPSSSQADGEGALEAWNPSAYYVSLARVELLAAEGPVVLEGLTAAPLGSTRFSLDRGVVPRRDHVRFEAVTDDGLIVGGVAALGAGAGP